MMMTKEVKMCCNKDVYIWWFCYDKAHIKLWHLSNQAVLIFMQHHSMTLEGDLIQSPCLMKH